MKIWIPALKTGSGSDVYIERLARGLQQRGVEVQVQWLPHQLELCPYALRLLKPPIKTDLIFANSWSAIGFTRHNIPVITCVHHCVHDPDYRPFKSGLQAWYHQGLIYPVERQGLKAASAIVTGSRFTQQKIMQLFDHVEPIFISYAIDTEQFKPAPKLVTSPAPYKLLFIGNPSRRKGFDLLSPIMRRLGPGFKLYFTTGLRHNQTTCTIPHADCTGNLSTHELIKLYQTCDALLFPTRYEGFGYAVAEAMACGLPVIASQCSAIPELLDEGLGGFLCPVDDVAYFVAKIQFLQANPQRAQAMGKYNRVQALEKFNMERMLDAYVTLFQQIIKNVRKTPPFRA